MAKRKDTKDENIDTKQETPETVSDDANDTIPAEDENKQADDGQDASDEETAEEDAVEDADKEEGSAKQSAQIEQLNDRIMRQMAEFENFRKRSEKEKAQMFDMGAKGILEKILPVIDNFERGLIGIEEDEEDPFKQGMQMIYKQMMTSLDEAGLKPIVAVGETFDPEYHNAVMHVDDEAYGENEIVEELQKGFMYHDSVVRHSMVKVAN